MEIKIDLPSLEEVDQTEKSDFLDAVERFIIKKFQENPNENAFEVTIDDIRNVAAMEEITEDYLESMKKLFEQKGIGINVSGESGKECFQFTMPTEKAI
ncbi:MAG: hypothetical protein KAQ87_05385 [Candidatus Pacebacteria bacterium]|nr:hypothetical protein [Candidatus Paceibacterota bacterium]